MNIIIVSNIVMLCDELGRHNITCHSAAEAKKLGNRLRTDPEFARNMLRLCRPGEAEPRTMTAP